MSASDWLLLVQTLVLAVTAVAAFRAVSTTSMASKREQLSARIRGDEHRLERIADQIARLSGVTADAQQGRVTMDPVNAEQLRLRALISPFSKYRMQAVKDYASGDPTHATKEDVGTALDEVADWLQTLRLQWYEQVVEEEKTKPYRRWVLAGLFVAAAAVAAWAFGWRDHGVSERARAEIYAREAACTISHGCTISGLTRLEPGIWRFRAGGVCVAIDLDRFVARGGRDQPPYGSGRVPC